MSPDNKDFFIMNVLPDSNSPSNPDLVLFSRPDCHLCDLAADLLAGNDHEFRIQNIDKDLELIRRYGIRIPVLYRPDIKAELFWPFDEDRLNTFLELEN